MKNVVRSLAAVSALLAFSSPAHAALTFTVNLTNAQEPGVTLTTSGGQPRPASFGTATFTINDAMTFMTFAATIFNIDFTGSQTPNDTNDNLTNAHIHASATGGTPTFPVVWGFIGTPFNDNNPNDAVVTPFATGVGGTVSGKWDLPEGNGTTFAAQLPNILAGRAYINFHTVGNPGGEVRGNFSQVLPVPEPSTWAMMLLGFGLVGASLRRRKIPAVV
jgi:hypothetical protein